MTVQTSGRDDGLLECVDAARRWKPKGNRRHDRWRYAAYGYEPEPIPSQRGTVEPPEPGAIGVCCSGGGVRSAAFNLQVASADTVKGSFRYEDGTEGTLIYGITVMTKLASWDVQAYHGQDPAFPHNSTVDQPYTDQRFEAYRALGFSAGTHAVALMRKRRGESRANGGANGRRVPAGVV